MDEASSRRAARPAGSFNGLSRRIALGLLSHWAEHEAQVLEKLSGEHFPQFIRLIGRLLPGPPRGDAPDLEAMPAADVARVLVAVRAALDRVEAGEGSLADVEAALSGYPLAGARTVNNGAETAAAGPPAVDNGAKTARPGAAHRGDRRPAVTVRLVPASRIAGAAGQVQGAVAGPGPPLNMEGIW